MSHPTDLNVYSMTGFGSAEAASSACKLTLQLKSVNSRYLDLSFKVPEELAQHESALRDAIFQRIKRGKIECKISWQNTSSTVEATPTLNTQALQQAIELQNQILAHSATAQTLSVQALLNWPNVMPNSSGAPTALAQVTPTEIDTIVHDALTAFLSSRAGEGAHLAHTINERLNAIKTIVDELRIALPELLAHQETRLSERLLKALDAGKADVAIATSAIPVDELTERIRQEASLTAIRIDVAEELDRLDGHIANARKTLSNGGGIGKKLDFLMQEFNREANTLGSKSASLLQTQAAMDLKLIIEQMREQVQNIE